MDRTGLSRYGEQDNGVRWVAIRRAADRIHIVAALARQDGGKPNLSGDHYRVRDACRAAEERYALRHTTPALSGTPRDIAARDYPVSAADAIQAGRRVPGDQPQQTPRHPPRRAEVPEQPGLRPLHRASRRKQAMNDAPGAGDQGRRLLTALDDLGNIATRSFQAWAGHLTIRQGYDITVTLGSSLDRLGAVADDLRRYRLTDQTGLAAGPAAGTRSARSAKRPGRSWAGGPP